VASRSTPITTGSLAGLSLCAGYGGLDLGLTIAEPDYHTVCYVEQEAHAAATLVARMEDAALAQAPIWDNLRTFDGNQWRGRIHILSAGYPCQPFSYSGVRKGGSDPRHLWPEVARIISEAQPTAVFLENVEGHVTLGLAEVSSELARLGYRAKAGLFTAREVGARHQRRRLFILAYSNGGRRRQFLRPEAGERPGRDSQGPNAIESQWRPNASAERCASLGTIMDGDDGTGLAACKGALPLFAPGPSEFPVWYRLLPKRPDLQPALLRVGHGMADRVERTRAAGNGVCSLAAAFAYTTLKTDFVREWGS
jgi:DNA (cytosine-5)-methyltransferase 1